MWSLWITPAHFIVPVSLLYLLYLLYLLHYLMTVYRVTEPRPWPWLRGLALWNHMHRRHLGGLLSLSLITRLHVISVASRAHFT